MEAFAFIIGHLNAVIIGFKLEMRRSVDATSGKQLNETRAINSDGDHHYRHRFEKYNGD